MSSPGATDAGRLNAEGNAHADAGRVGEAVACYRRAIELDPSNSDTWNNLGIAYAIAAQPAEAVPSFRRALELDPGNAQAWNNLGLALHTLGQLDEALAAYGEALRRRPNYVRAWINSARAHEARQSPAEAARCYEQALALDPRQSDARFALANLKLAAGRFESAIAGYRELLTLVPDHAPALHNLGCAEVARGELESAIAHLRRAIALGHATPEAWHNLGAALLSLGKPAEAEASYRESLARRPDNADTHAGLGLALAQQDRLRAARESYEQALQLAPGHIEAHMNLASVLRDSGRFDESLAHYRAAIAQGPAGAKAWSNYLFALNYHPTLTAREIAAEHRRWGEQQGSTPADFGSLPITGTSTRLRIGYVSPDFRAHAVATFMEQVLAHHDPAAVETFCYAELGPNEEDETTERLRGLAGHWRSTRGVGDPEVARQIRADGIDVLVDLAGHTAGNRLGVFACRAAPAQATWLGYVNGTGLPAMDWRITDRHADPEGAEALYVEKLARLPDAFFCYTPPDAPPVAPAPALATGQVSFGSFNRYSKINARVLDAWAAILARVPGSRLLLQCGSFGEPEVRNEIGAEFARRGVDPKRLLLRPSAGFADYLAAHHEVDIVLDSFPHAGHTVTCHALWMGVPVVTLAGDRYAARMGADTARLGTLRAGLRQRFQASALCDPARFTRGLEAACRRMRDEAG